MDGLEANHAHSDPPTTAQHIHFSQVVFLSGPDTSFQDKRQGLLMVDGIQPLPVLRLHGTRLL